MGKNEPLIFDLQLFAGEDGGGATGGEGGQTPPAAGAANPLGAAVTGGGQDPPKVVTPPAKTDPPEPQKQPQVDSGKVTIETEYFNRVKKQKDDAEAKLRQYEAQEAEAKRKQLEDQGKYREVAELAEQRAKAAENSSAARIKAIEQRAILSELKARLAVEGIIDPDDAKLIDTSTINLDESSDAVIGDLVTKFKTSKPHKFKSLEQKSVTPAVTAAVDANAETQAQGGNANADPAKTGTPAARPIPVASGNTPTPKDAMSMDDGEFAALMQKTYGGKVQF